MTFVDRYEAAGLRHNPFAAHQAGDPTLAGFVSRGLPEPPPPGSRTLVQVIGDSGFGKSTQLQQWRSIAPAPCHYIVRNPYLERWERPPAPTPHGLLYGDEIDRMPHLLRRRWFRACSRAGATLIVGTHADLTRVATSAGLAVITHQLAPASPQLLRQIVDARIEAAALKPNTPSPIRFSDADLVTVLVESKGVLREADVICHRLLADRILSFAH